MTTPASDRVKVFIDNCAQIYLNALRQYGSVASHTVDQIDKGKFGAKEWLGTMTQLCDIAALSSIELAETVLSGPGAPPAPKSIKSLPVELTGLDAKRAHILTMAEPLTQGGTTVHPERVGFSPGAEGDDDGSCPLVLPAGETTFRVVADTTDLPGGTYVGTVRVHPQDDDPQNPDDSKDKFVLVQVVW